MPSVCPAGNVWLDRNENGMLEAGECLDPNVSSSTADPSRADEQQVAAAATEVGANLFAALGGASYVYALGLDTKGNVVAKTAFDGKTSFTAAPIVELVIVDAPRFKTAVVGKPVTGVEAFARFAFVELDTKSKRTEDFRALEAGLALATQKPITVRRVRGKLTFSVASKK